MYFSIYKQASRLTNWRLGLQLSFPLPLMNHMKGVMAMSKKKNPARHRNRAVTVRMTDEEFLAMREKVEESGLSQQTYIIEAVTGTPILPADGVEELLSEWKADM